MNLENTKIWIGDNPELSKNIQLALFKKGILWGGISNKIKHTSMMYLTVDNHNHILYGHNKRAYERNSKKEISYNCLIDKNYDIIKGLLKNES